MKLFNVADFVIISLACLVTIWLYSKLWFPAQSSSQAEQLSVQVADQPAQYYSLKTDKSITIQGEMGTSIIEIKQSKVRFIHSVCRNKLCIFHGWLSLVGDTNACLPNQISITLIGNSHYDAIAGSQ